MEAQAILIAGFSGRALAQSARRAGFTPLVVDGFGDEDTRAAAAGSEHVPDIVTHGFRSSSLLPALDRLTAGAESPPIGLVLGAGFEGVPALVEHLDARYRVLGCSADTIRQAKDPMALAALPRRARNCLPGDPARPACRRRRLAVEADRRHRRDAHYRGTPPTADAGAISNAKSPGRRSRRSASWAPAIARSRFSRQWAAPAGRRPYRYGGATGSLELDPDLEARMIEIGLEVSRALSLVGLVSLDFLVTPDAAPVLLEINPRPGATLDVFDDAAGTLFKAHIAAALGTGPLDAYFAAWSPPVARAVAYLYADRGDLEIPPIAWPEWAFDRPAPGRSIARHQPIATVSAEGGDTRQAEALCRERLGLLERMLYEDTTGKETPS